jgi:outer membrane protein assembly factor BamB
VNLETMKGDSVKVEHTAPDSLAAGSGLLFACTSWNVAAIDPQAGHVVWQKQMRPIFDPAVCGHGVLVVDEDHRLWALDPKSGQVLWSVDDVDQPPVAVGERVIAAHRMGQKHVVRAYDSKGGRLWEVNAGSTTSRPAAEPGRLYFRTQEGSVFVVDAAGGQVVKKFKSDDDWATDPAVVNGVVYVGSYRKMLALDTRSETVVWTYEALEPVHAPCVAGGRVYFGSEDRHVYAVWAGDPDADGWPCYRGNAQRTASK